MAHISSSNSIEETLNSGQRQILLDVAHASIQYGLRQGKALKPNREDYEPALNAQLACIVTLETRGSLRGCIGHLEAIQPLIIDVAENAFAAAFRDPRFPPLGEEEYPHIQLHISILSPAQPMSFVSEEDLTAQIRPGLDGLIMQEGTRRGTFLPSVWESLPEAKDFLRHLKTKAGLPPDHWSNTLEIYRYTTETFSD